MLVACAGSARQRIHTALVANRSAWRGQRILALHRFNSCDRETCRGRSVAIWGIPPVLGAVSVPLTRGWQLSTIDHDNKNRDDSTGPLILFKLKMVPIQAAPPARPNSRAPPLHLPQGDER